MSAYITLAAAGEIEIVILRSRFIASGGEVQDVASAEALLKEIQQKYPDANHHCYAFKVKGPPLVDRFSDDGEPGGTAGRPILTVLEHSAQNAIIVVTRYFGGTKLGTGGLVKAYTQAAKALIDKVGLIAREPAIALRLEYPYTLAGPLEYWYKQQGFSPELSYTTHISAELQIPVSRLPAAEAALQDWSHQGLNWRPLDTSD